MMYSHSRPEGMAAQKGFSIVELMVAILIGLIILAGVIQVVITSKTSFLGQEEMSYIQENARYSMDVLSRDLQSAGYWGCTGNDVKAAVAATNTTAPELLGLQSLGGYDGTQYDGMPNWLKTRVRGVPDADSAATNPQGYPDVLLVRSAGGVTAGLTAHTNAGITMDRNLGLPDGSFLTIVGENCQRLSVVRTDTVSGNAITYSTAGNCSTSIKPKAAKPTYDCSETFEPYTPGATVMEYGAKAYFIGESSTLEDQPALKRATLRADGIDIEELALGVEDMNVLYGVGDGTTLQYKSADAVTNNEWPNVRAVQIQLLYRSQSGSMNEAEVRNFPELNKTFNDRFMRQLVTSTLQMRNRI